MRLSGDAIKTVASAVSILTVLGGIMWYAANLDQRVRRLEEQVHALTVAPTIAGASGQPATIPNPVAQACADLARKAADEASHGSLYGEREAENMLEALGCTQSQSGQ
jgi:hypothetical protein